MTDSVTLREYIEKIIDERDKYNRLALDIASKEVERRLEALNELRGEVLSDRTQYVLKALYESKHNDLSIRISSMERLVYIGVGIAIVATIFLQFLFHYLGIK